MPAPARFAAVRREAARKNRETYDHAASGVWRTLVYQPVHEGWEFANMGGRRILDHVGRRAGLGPASHALELCSGTGACCRYLATRFGCAVTGVEMNPRLAAHVPAVRHPRVRVVRADVLAWRPPRRYDAVYAMDSLVLIPDLPGALAKARQALAPGGVLVLAEMTAGPRITPELRTYAWDQDGIIHLPTPGEWRSLVEAAGFAGVEVRDAGALAVRCWKRIHAAAVTRAAVATDERERRVSAEWAGLAEFYRGAFGGGGYGYARVTAVAI